MDNNFKKLDIFVERMNKIGIQLKFGLNVPWVYLDSINGKPVKEKHASKHGFVVGYLPVKIGKDFHFSDEKLMFNLIRKYL